jgi:hypothetical protein
MLSTQLYTKYHLMFHIIILRTFPVNAKIVKFLWGREISVLHQQLAQYVRDVICMYSLSEELAAAECIHSSHPQEYTL